MVNVAAEPLPEAAREDYQVGVSTVKGQTISSYWDMYSANLGKE